MVCHSSMSRAVCCGTCTMESVLEEVQPPSQSSVVPYAKVVTFPPENIISLTWCWLPVISTRTISSIISIIRVIRRLTSHTTPASFIFENTIHI